MTVATVQRVSYHEDGTVYIVTPGKLVYPDTDIYKNICTRLCCVASSAGPMFCLQIHHNEVMESQLIIHS